MWVIHRGMEGWMEDGWVEGRQALLCSFEEIWSRKMGLAGPGQLPLSGACSVSLSLTISFCLCCFLSLSLSLFFFFTLMVLTFTWFLFPPSYQLGREGAFSSEGVHLSVFCPEPNKSPESWYSSNPMFTLLATTLLQSHPADLIRSCSASKWCSGNNKSNQRSFHFLLFTSTSLMTHLFYLNELENLS